MQAVTTIGLDIAKSVFQVHGIGAEGNVLIRRQLKRRYVLAFFEKLPPCLVGIEACASSHHWSRQLKALGHTVRLMPPAYVKPYVKRQKNDATDAEAICEAVTRANMRFVETKTPEQQSCLMLHRTRQLFIRQQTSVINAIRAHLAEFGIVAPVGRKGVEQLLDVVADASDTRVPEVARACLAALGAQLRRCKEQILEFDRMIMAWHRSNETSRRLDAIPGIGPALATALVASVADPKAFRSGRNFSAWIGLVPKQHSSGGKNKLGSISKQGDRYLRSLFTAGALAVIRYAKIHGTKHRPWLTALLRILTRQRRLSEPTDVTARLYSVGVDLLSEFDHPGPFRLVGMAAYDLVHFNDQIQLDLFGTFARQRRLDVVIDKLAERFGSDVVRRANDLTETPRLGSNLDFLAHIWLNAANAPSRDWALIMEDYRRYPGAWPNVPSPEICRVASPNALSDH